MKLFWIFYELILVLCALLFILRIQAIWRVFMRLRENYSLAPETITDGHRQRKTRSEIKSALQRCKTELCSWVAIAAVGGYAIIVSIRKDFDTNIFQFPKPVKLKKCLYDYLEKEVDEKYYIDDEKVKALIPQLKEKMISNAVRGGDMVQ